MAKAIVNFRTMQNGGYQHIKKHQQRGWWRVFIVDHDAPYYKITDANVICELYKGREGIAGVTDRSGYCIDDTYDKAVAVAKAWNKKIEKSRKLR